MFSRIFTILLLLIAFKATAQREAVPRDLIITQAGEQIRCRIVDESSMRFSYVYVNEKGKPVKTEIFKTLISSFKYNYFPEDLPAGKKMPPAKESVVKNSSAESKKEAVAEKNDKRAGDREVPVTGGGENGAKNSAGNETKDTWPADAKENPVKNSSAAGKKEVLAQKPEDKRAGVKGGLTGNQEKAAGNAPDSEKKDKSAQGAGTQEKIAKNSSGEKKDASPSPALKAEEQRNSPDKAPGEKAVAENGGRKSSAAEAPQPAGGTPDSTALAGEQGSEYVSPLKGKTEFTNYLKYRIGFKGGLGNIVDDNADKSPFGLFNEKLRRGWVYGVDAAVFLNDHIGIGVTYQSFQSQNKNANLNSAIATGAGEDFMIRSLESKVNHKFVGPTLLGRLGMDYKTFIVATVSPGYYFYSDKGIVNQMNYEYKGGAWGGAATLGIDFLIGNNETGRDVILSFECGYNYGQLKSLNPDTNGWHKLPIQMNRLDFAVGLRFTRFPRYLR